MTKLILINGKKRSGKDFVANLIQEELYKNEKTSEIMSFADPIKDIIATTFDIPLSELDEYKNESTEILVKPGELWTRPATKRLSNFRLILQRFGTEAMKKWFGESVWADTLHEMALRSNCDYVLIPDFRFKCEEISDITLKIRNDVIDNQCTDSHRSENELNDFDFKYVIDNTGYRDVTDDVAKFVKDVLGS